MLQPQIPGQNKQVYIQNYGIPITQNVNQYNQVQYQRQIPLQQNQKFQQPQNLQNAQVIQPHKLMPNYQNNQALNAQKVQQAQNIQKMQNLQNPQKLHNAALPQNINHHNQLQKTGIKQPQGAHNLPPQANQIAGNNQKGKNQKQLAGSHLNLSQTPNLETVKPNQPGHLQIQQKHLHPPKKEAEEHNQPLMENLKNTAFIPMTTTAPQQNPPLNNPQSNATKKSATLMTLNSLANLPYNAYPKVEFSKKPFFNISGYGSNSYNGKIKSYNEDMAKTIVNFPKKIVINNQTFSPNISYFGIFDGHGGDKCSKFLKQNLDTILFNSQHFQNNNIIDSIRDAFQKAESQFYQIAIKNGKLVDKSGSCALIALIINNTCYAINLGDSRALYSRDSGKAFYQITRDHKPNDEKEKKRIEKMGGKVYYANKTTVNGVEVTLKEEQFGKGFTFPYRLSPSGLAVVRTIGDYYSKLPQFGGIKGTNINLPCVNRIQIDDKSDFILLGCDGIYDRLENDQILNKIWSYKKAGQTYNDIHSLCGKITDAIIKYSMEKNSVDNVTVTFIAFKNFENKMKDPNFEYKCSTKCQPIQEIWDLSTM